jgi:hypothetical protein
MSDHDAVAMEAPFNEEQHQTPITLMDVPATEAAATESFFDEDDDGFGDFEDAAWETAPETNIEQPAPPAFAPVAPPTQATTTTTTTAGSTKKDILSLNPAAFLDAATATMSRFSPLSTTTPSLNKATTNITTLKDLINKFSQRKHLDHGNPAPSSASSLPLWKGSVSEARLLHRLVRIIYVLN